MMSWALVILLLAAHQMESWVAGLCPEPYDMYVKRESYLLCRKVYNCRPENEIVPCERNCEQERCVPCPEGKVQPNLIHSVSPNNERKCFTPEPNQCNSRDLVSTQNGQDIRTCPAAEFCRCDLNKCFYGDNPCLCDRLFEECREGYALHNNGSCLPCPEGYFKPYNGCQACYLRDPYENMTPKPVPVTPVPTVPPTKTQTTTIIVSTEQHKEDTTRSTVSKETTPAKPKVTMGMLDMVSKSSNTAIESSDKTVSIVIIIIIVILLIFTIAVFILLYRKRKLHYLRDRWCGPRTADTGGVQPVVEPETIIMLPDLLNNGRVGEDQQAGTVPVQEEAPGSPSSQDSHPLIPPSSPGVTLDEPPLSQVLQIKEAVGGGHCSLESYTSGTSSGSVPTPVPETGPSGGSHPLENVGEYLRSLSREGNPAQYGFPVPTPDDSTIPAAATPSSPSEGSTVNISSSTSAVPPSSTTTPYPSHIVSNSMETVGTQDHRVSAIYPTDTNLESPKVPQQSLLTNSLSSDNADNVHALGTLEPLENEDETFKNDQSVWTVGKREFDFLREDSKQGDRKKTERQGQFSKENG